MARVAHAASSAWSRPEAAELLPNVSAGVTDARQAGSRQISSSLAEIGMPTAIFSGSVVTIVPTRWVQQVRADLL